MNGPCPGCNGRGSTDGSGPDEQDLFVCPDCAGTGRAKNSITVNENEAEAWRRHWMEAVTLEHKAVKRGNRLAAALKECVRKLDTCEKSYRIGGGQDFANSIAQVSSDARAALREAGVDDA